MLSIIQLTDCRLLQQCWVELLIHLDLKYDRTREDPRQWRVSVSDCPQQVNGNDCGVYACASACTAVCQLRTTYSPQSIPLFRRHIATSIMNGHLSGRFDHHTVGHFQSSTGDLVEHRCEPVWFVNSVGIDDIPTPATPTTPMTTLTTPTTPKNQRVEDVSTLFHDTVGPANFNSLIAEACRKTSKWY